MKELTIEQKAKAYDEALERASKLGAQNPFDTVSQMMEHVFPELREIDGENVRKALLDFFNRGAKNGEQTNGVYDKDILAWLELQGETFTKKDVNDAYLRGICDAKQELEKQGEQRTVDKVEPKFKAGDWVVLTAGDLSTTLQIVNVDTNKKRYWFNDSSYLPVVDEECLRHWTIQDAKDGDVLVSQYDNPFIYNGKHDYFTIGAYCGLAVDSFDIATVTNPWTENLAIRPATKVQRDILFHKMKEAGFEFDFEKKELKKSC